MVSTLAGGTQIECGIGDRMRTQSLTHAADQAIAPRDPPRRLPPRPLGVDSPRAGDGRAPRMWPSRDPLSSKRRGALAAPSLPSLGPGLRHGSARAERHQTPDQGSSRRHSASGCPLAGANAANQPTAHDPRSRRRAGLGRSGTAGRRGQLPAASERAGASRPARTQPWQTRERHAAHRPRPSGRSGSHPLAGRAADASPASRGGFHRLRVEPANPRFEVDVLWRELEFAVEIDGYDAHSGRLAFERDRLKIAILKAHGLDVMPITPRQLRDDPDGVVARLVRALELAGYRGSG
jgi:hypothetical protein